MKGLTSNRLLLVTMGVELAWAWMLLPFPLLLFSGHELYKWRRRRVLAGTER